MKKKRISIRILIGVLLFLLLCVGGYLLYLEVTYYRIDDEISLETQNNRSAGQLQAGQSYTLATYNIGFGGPTNPPIPFSWTRER